MGIYYSAPLLGPALGPIFGGVLAQRMGWRSIFWFVMICGAVVLLALVLIFKDTFRKERSLAYQNALQSRIRQQEAQHSSISTQTTIAPPAAVKLPPPALGSTTSLHETGIHDIETNVPVVAPPSSTIDITLSLADVNPFPPLLKILTRLNNLAVLFASGKCPSI